MFNHGLLNTMAYLVGHGLIQTKWLEKVQHIESWQSYTHTPSVTLTDGSLYNSCFRKVRNYY